MAGKKSEFVAITAEDINQLPSPPEDFLVWVWGMFGQGELDSLVNAVISAGLAKTASEGLGYLCSVYQDQAAEQVRIVNADLTGSLQSGPLKRLGQIMGKDPVVLGEAQELRQMGTHGHKVIPQLLLGRLPSYRAATARQKQVTQLSLLNGDHVDALLKVHHLEKLEHYPDVVLPGNRLDQGHVRSLRLCWEKISRILLSGTSYDDKMPQAEVHLHELYGLLEPVFGQQLVRLLGTPYQPTSRYALLLTLMSWSVAVFHVHNYGRMYFANEVCTPKFEHASLGRIDALMVQSIDGVTLDKLPGSARRSLADLLRFRFSSVGQAYMVLTQALGRSVKVIIGDWKFCGGDALDPYGIIEPAEVMTEPLPHHAARMMQYLAAANLDYHITRTGRASGEIWRGSPFRSGSIFYFLPTSPELRVHQIGMTTAELEEEFRLSFVARWPRGRICAVLRSLSNLLANHLLGVLGEGNNHAKNGKPQRLTDKSPRLSANLSFRPIMEQIIDRHRVWVDARQVIEKISIGRDGAGRLVLHLDKLLQLTRAGTIACHEDANQDVWTNCLSPDHQDEESSLHIYIKPGLFKCLVCGFSGVLALESVEPEARASLQLFRQYKQANKGRRQFYELVIPPEHHRVMACAQDCLHKEFFRNQGWWEYLAEKYQVDPELAYDSGAGFANAQLIRKLLEGGFAYDELIHYGFVGIASSRSARPDISGLLGRHGLSLEQIKRPLPGGKGEGLPYSVLQGRITWPLEVGGSFTNICGLATWKCSDKVLWNQLSTKETGLPSGAFNMARAETPDYREVIITESVLQALQAEARWQQPAVAVLDSRSQVIAEVLAISGKEQISLAFGEEEIAAKLGKDFKAWLLRAGFKGELVELSA